MSGEALSILQMQRARWRRQYLRRRNVWGAGLILCLTSAENIADKCARGATEYGLIVKWVKEADDLYASGERPWEEP